MFNNPLPPSEPDTVQTPSSLQDVPFATEFILVSRQEVIQFKADRNRYKSLHQRALLKIKELEEALTLEKGKVQLIPLKLVKAQALGAVT